MLALAFVAIAVVGAVLSAGDRESDDGPPVAAPDPLGSSGTPAPASPPGGAAPATPPATPPTQAPGGSSAGGPADAEQLLERNGLYTSVGVPATACRVDDPRAGDDAAMADFLEKLDGCLRRLWARQFQATNMPWVPATVHIWHEQGRGPCGVFDKPGVAAFYCPANETIYLGASHITDTAGAFQQFPVVYVRLFAHEYGHHVQAASGIIDGEDELYRRDPTPANKREIVRRGELQADCFAGLFLHAVSGTYPLSENERRVMYADVRGRGDDGRPAEDRDHGRGVTRQRWLGSGYESGVPRRCNTWSASEADTT